jgi:aldehyde dehydrogenase (NAD+)
MIQHQKETKVMQRFEMFINGESCGPASGEWFDTENPFTGETWAQIAKGNATDVDRAVQAAHAAFSTGPWSQMSPSQRGLLLHRVGDLIARDAKRLAELEVRDNGKLMAEMLGQCQYLPQWY